MHGEKKSSHNLILPIMKTDKFSQWEKDLLFGQIEIHIEAEQPLPEYWRLDPAKVSHS